jgi:hypothetical protein
MKSIFPIGKNVLFAIFVSPLCIFGFVFVALMAMSLQYGMPALSEIPFTLAGVTWYSLVISIVPILLAYVLMLVYVLPIHLYLVRRGADSVGVYLIGSLPPALVLSYLGIVKGLPDSLIFLISLTISLVFWRLTHPTAIERKNREGGVG